MKAEEKFKNEKISLKWEKIKEVRKVITGALEKKRAEKSIGSTIDDVSLLNLDSVNVSLSQTDGKYRFISYIFSRCPMPNLCPAIVLKNAALAHQFPEVEFIMVSFDYKYDTPAVLKKAYGPSVINYRNWDVWSSIGRIEDVTLIGSKYLSGVEYNTDATAKYKVNLINLYSNVYFYEIEY